MGDQRSQEQIQYENAKNVAQWVIVRNSRKNNKATTVLLKNNGEQKCYSTPIPHVCNDGGKEQRSKKATPNRLQTLRSQTACMKRPINIV